MILVDFAKPSRLAPKIRHLLDTVDLDSGGRDQSPLTEENGVKYASSAAEIQHAGVTL